MKVEMWGYYLGLHKLYFLRPPFHCSIRTAFCGIQEFEGRVDTYGKTSES